MAIPRASWDVVARHARIETFAATLDRCCLMYPENLFDVLSDAATRYGERQFLIVGRRDKVASFRELRDSADACGRMLAALGVMPGDRVAICIRLIALGAFFSSVAPSPICMPSLSPPSSGC